MRKKKNELYNNENELLVLRRGLLKAFGLLLVIMTIIGISGYIGTDYSSRKMDGIAKSFPTVMAAFIISEAQTGITAAEGALLNQELEEVGAFRQYRKIELLWRRIDEALEYTEKSTTKKEKELWQSFREHLAKWRTGHLRYMNYSRRLDRTGYRRRHLEGRGATLEEMDTLIIMSEQIMVINDVWYSKSHKILQQIIDINMAERIEDAKKTRDRVRFITLFVLFSVLFGIGFALISGLFMTRRITEQNERLFNKERERSQLLLKMDKLKDDFLANTSHELRTPLNGIIGIAESLIDGVAGKLPLLASQNIAIVISSAKRLSSLVNDILDFSRMKNQQISLKCRNVDLYSLVEVILAITKPSISGKKLELINAVDPGLSPVEADENRLQQIFYNLIGNAVKFTQKGEVKVSAGIIDGKVEISVSDTGIGIPSDRLEDIFNSFEQVDGSIEREYGGTGLGLAVSKKLVELHGSSIQVTSRVGEGSTFSFRLPFFTKSILAPDPEVSTIHDYNRVEIETLAQIDSLLQKSSTGSKGSTKLLVVDDEIVNLQVIYNILSTRDYEVIKASDGREALEYVKAEGRPHLILLDVMMPRMSGFEVIKNLRKNYSPTELPIILLTAKNKVEDLVTGFDSGANDYLVKPFSKKELLSRIETQLRISHQHEELKEKARMKKELEIAEQIQTAIVPDPPETNELEISTLMKPAVEIGGDYYDILYDKEGYLWFAIGDVTGHGLTSGLIMMMAQSSFSTVLHEHRSLNPAEAIIAVNHLLYLNIKERIKEEHLMTMNFLKYLGKGEFEHAGAHIDIIVYRQDRKKCELVETAGPFLGMIPDVSRVTPVSTFKLNPGDFMLLFTDGIIEARHTKTRQFFDIPNLLDTINGQAHNDLDTIKAEIIRRVLEWSGGKQTDDITMVLVKHKNKKG